MKRLICLLYMLPLLAQESLPIPVKQFQLFLEDIPHYIQNPVGKIEVVFDIDEKGRVQNPNVIDTFNIELNKIVIDKVKQTKYKPAIQNGRPVRVRFRLPIVFN